MELLRTIGPKFKIEYLIDIIIGKATPIMKSYKHDELEQFGQGKDNDGKFWNTILRQCLIQEFINKDIENYGLLSISEKGMNYLEKPESIMMSKDNYYPIDDNASMGAFKGGAADNVLLLMLKDLLKEVAKKEELPPFVIFQDPSLEDMATQYPITMEEMYNITGVGVGKASKYASRFIELIKRYVDENEIDRPQDMIVKSLVNKSGNKVAIIQSIDRKMNLEDVATAKGLNYDELLTEIEAIINSGTKLNIDYYITDVIDEDKLNDIYDYFCEDAQDDTIDSAMEELGGDYSEEEIRLVRIKFFNEKGN